ncbi:MAG: exopolyphosphatase [Oscillospiraceae bacterium]|jgi:nanoRNase/pAp phosphatase (c-di-AMP/oligoRNAs hydrolase)|nr:exopolyphosphatase [Oscillospiraceae bacterium]
MQLLTRSDFDGLACGALLKKAGVVDGFKFVHPKDIQDGIVEATENDVLANIPYIPGCGIWFDHHSSEIERVGDVDVPGDRRVTPSCARIVFDYYGGKEKFPHLAQMIDYVDRVDSADLTAEEVSDPKGWVLLGFLMDPRTGLGRFREFRISNYDLMQILLDACAELSIEEILDLPDVRERVELYLEQNAQFGGMVEQYSKVYNNCLVTDLRGVETIYSGNRFLPYGLYPETNISLWIVDGRGKQNCPIACGHSTINRSSRTNVGSLMLKYGGGGHERVGTCQVDYGEADRVIAELVEKINADG